MVRYSQAVLFGHHPQVLGSRSGPGCSRCHQDQLETGPVVRAYQDQLVPLEG